MEPNATIAAISTPLGEGGIGIIRVSGPDALQVLERVFVPAGRKAEWESHRVYYGHIRGTAPGEWIDEVLVTVMLAPRTYTREDTVEINCHSGLVPLRQIMAAVLREGVRLAEPGEFTKRAFLNGRIDLVQAEAVIDIIRAKTELSLRQAVGQLSGRLSGRIKAMRAELLELIAFVEAVLDFPDEEIPEVSLSEIQDKLAAMAAEVECWLATASTGRILREGLATVIAGKPNVGKSSLLNALLRENRAIVTEIPGTTRDLIEESYNLGGIPLKIIDTAGIRHAADAVEQIGVERARESIRRADLVLFVLDDAAGITAEDREIALELAAKPALVLVNKTDLGMDKVEDAAIRAMLPGADILRLSVREGGVEALEQKITELVYAGKAQKGEDTLIGNLRHQSALESAHGYLTNGAKAAAVGVPADIVVIDIRAAWDKLGEITGETAGESLLDEIFARFCLGK